jgi:hypothetical protein
MATTTYHICLDIRGALKQTNRQINGLFHDDNGKPISGAEAREILLDELQTGKRFLPVGKCDNFDYQQGCLGHKTPEQQP